MSLPRRTQFPRIPRDLILNIHDIIHDTQGRLLHRLPSIALHSISNIIPKNLQTMDHIIQKLNQSKKL
jgi:hypothetical protein